MTVGTSDPLDVPLKALKADQHDEEAWRQLYRLLVPCSKTRAYRLLGGDASSAQDAVHDAMLRLLRRNQFVRLESATILRRYFAVILHNVCLDHLRSKARAARREEVHDFMAEDEDKRLWVSAPGPGPEEQADHNRRMAAAESFLGRDERMLFELLRRGYEPKEIAARLGLTYDAATKRVQRLYSRLDALARQGK